MSGARQRARAREPQHNASDTSSAYARNTDLNQVRRGIPNVDGPASRGTGSIGSQAGFPATGSQTGSRRSSVSHQSQQAPQTSATIQTGLDPALERQVQFTDSLRNVDLPPTSYNINGTFQLATQFARRPGRNTTGKTINIPVNAYRVLRYPQIKIHQYDVAIGNGAEKRAVIAKVWNSPARKGVTSDAAIFDGNKLAWSLHDYGTEQRVMVDLDAAEGRPSRNGANSFRLHIRKTKVFDISVIANYLAGRVQFNVQVGEAINFLDHVLREGPSRSPNMISVKRSLFTRNGSRMDLTGGIEVFRGIYQSLRIVEGQKMIVNLDVANSCFYRPGALINLFVQKNDLNNPSQVAQNLATPAHIRANKSWMSKLSVKASYNGNKYPNKVWKIKGISPDTASTHNIEWKDPTTNQGTGQQISIATYFMRRYNVRLQFPNLPLIEMTSKKALFPMELLVVIEHQRYGSKLNEKQTANMIKFAVAPPTIRQKAIEEGKSWLNWQEDKFLTGYGLSIDDKPVVTQARILPSPAIRFGKGKTEQPGLKGRWDLRGKAFAGGNPQELVSWGIGFFSGKTINTEIVQKFALDFAKQYRGHGGQVSNQPPAILALGTTDVADAVQKLFQATGNKFQRRPELLVFVVQNKDSFNYKRIKKSCDCRYGIVSQVMQASHVLKGAPQYYSNVLMKVNAKLGGFTSTSAPATGSGFKGFAGPTMFIGADVSHAAPGSDGASMAAITVSFDKNAARYAAACQTNGKRVEMISEKNFDRLLTPLVQQWAAQLGGGNLPSQIYYMRDGVSEGQYAHVIQEELPAIRGVLNKIANGKGWNGKITIVIASKRHHIRAFPRQGDGDPKGNPVPGTLIEQDVTMPNEWDFYLYSHIALQGTSRPVHYTVILDEANHQPNSLQNMIYEHCYQYMRSTTSVSLHPAVYYAHLASNRAAAHDAGPATQGQKGGPGVKANQPEDSEADNSEVADLLPLYQQGNIRFTMWYI